MFALACVRQTEEDWKKERGVEKKNKKKTRSRTWMNGGEEGSDGQTGGPERQRHICTCLASPSAVFSPGTLTPTAARQEAVTSFGCVTGTVLWGGWKIGVRSVFGFVYLWCSTVTQRNSLVAKHTGLGRPNWSYRGVLKVGSVTSQWM